MEQKEKVSGTQVGMLMFVFVTSTIIIYVPGFTAIDAKESAWLAASLLPFSFGFLTLWVVNKLGNYFPKLTIFQYCEVILGKFLGKGLEISYIIFLLVMDALVLREFSDFIVITTLPLTPKICLLTCILFVNVTIKVKGSIAEDNGVDLAPSEIDQVEQAISEQIGKMAMHTIETVQGYESDCLGFSEELHRYSPKDWEKVKAHWRETFLDANVDVQVNASVENTGRLGQRLELKK